MKTLIEQYQKFLAVNCDDESFKPSFQYWLDYYFPKNYAELLGFAIMYISDNPDLFPDYTYKQNNIIFIRSNDLKKLTREELKNILKRRNNKRELINFLKSFIVMWDFENELEQKEYITEFSSFAALKRMYKNFCDLNNLRNDVSADELIQLIETNQA